MSEENCKTPIPWPTMRMQARAGATPSRTDAFESECGSQPRGGLEETLTVHQLRVPDQLRRTLSCTNVIESAFSIVETVCWNVKRWRDGDQIERWVGSGLLVAERQFRKVIGYRQIPLLLSSMTNAVSQKPVAKNAAIP